MKLLENSIARKILKSVIPESILEKCRILRDRVFFSQFGEDVILNAIFNNKPKGFYVDVGAYHPTDLSNTRFFYEKGWNGINVEPTPTNFDLFTKKRPRDINVNSLISLEENHVDFYTFKEGTLNTISKKSLEEYINLGYTFDSVIKVPSIPLEKLLDRYLPENAQIDFLSVDVEGADLAVLKSNNWEKYSPSVVLVEDLKFHFDELGHNRIDSFLRTKGFSLCSVAGPTLLYMNECFRKWYNSPK